MNCAPSFHVVEETDSPVSRDWRPGSPTTCLETSWEEQLLEQQEHLEKEMEEAKKMISGLQVAPSLVVRSSSVHQLIIILKSLVSVENKLTQFCVRSELNGEFRQREYDSKVRQFLLCE